jgi:hypothetical protein
MIELKCKCGKRLKVPVQMAGKKGKCPACATVFTIPAPAASAPKPQPRPAAAAPATAAPAAARSVPARAPQDDFFADLPPIQQGPAPGTPAAIPGYDALMPQGFDHVPPPQENPYASPAAPAAAPAKNPYAAYGPPQPAGGRIGCYSCGCPDHTKIYWTFWGGMVGPLMLSHVRCKSCGTTYNSKTGKSNNTAITIYLVVSLVIGIGLGLFGAIAGLGN